MAQEFPEVEIFVLNYNGGPYLSRTLRTIFGQTYPRLRVILSDNGSTDSSAAQAQTEFGKDGLEVRFRNPGTGDCYSHYNLCLSEARAPYVAIFHGDDLYAPEMVSKQIAFLESHSAVDAVLCAGTAIDENDRQIWPIRIPAGLAYPVLDPRQVLEHTLRNGNSFFICPSALFRTDLFGRIGPVRADFISCGDLELFLRIALYGRGLGYLDELLFQYRMSTRQGSSTQERARTGASEFFVMLDELLAQPGLPVRISDETRRAYEALRHLDRLQAGLNRLAKSGRDQELLRQEANWFSSPEGRAHARNFGGLDRIRVACVRFGIRRILWYPALASAAARRLINFVDPRTSPLMQLALRVNRRRAAG
jgi:GT2 family glycosyltransferase